MIHRHIHILIIDTQLEGNTFLKISSTFGLPMAEIIIFSIRYANSNIKNTKTIFPLILIVHPYVVEYLV